MGYSVVLYMTEILPCGDPTATDVGGDMSYDPLRESRVLTWRCDDFGLGFYVNGKTWRYYRNGDDIGSLIMAIVNGKFSSAAYDPSPLLGVDFT